MMTEILIRYMPFLAIMALASVTIVQHHLVARELDIRAIRKLRVLDTLAGASAVKRKTILQKRR
ncbi:MAG: hypothetical protein K6L80_11285 [Agarilytica sp.]